MAGKACRNLRLLLILLGGLKVKAGTGACSMPFAGANSLVRFQGLPSQRASVCITGARSTSSTVEPIKTRMSSFGVSDCAVFSGAAR